MEVGDLSRRSVGAVRKLASFFESMAVAAKEGKKALARLLAKAKHAA
jgi:hypothetical protein